tara:strand:+ start:157 stop:426 length:270 start_codon:yes stop_codon:yes gene_type:complete
MEENEKSREYLKEEIKKYKYITYKNIHVNPTVEIKPDMDINKLNSYVKNTIINLYKNITKEKSENKSLSNMVTKIYEYREGLEKIIKNN